MSGCGAEKGKTVSHSVVAACFQSAYFLKTISSCGFELRYIKFLQGNSISDDRRQSILKNHRNKIR